MNRMAAAALALCLLLLSACGGAKNTPATDLPDAPAEEQGETQTPVNSSGGPDGSEETETPDAAEPPDTPGEPAGQEDPSEGAEPSEENPSAETPAESGNGEAEAEPLTKEEIAARFLTAMEALEPEVRLHVSGLAWEFGAENDLKNIFYSVLAQYPELKYTYDLEPTVEGEEARCAFRYMPYKTGAYSGGLPAGSHTVGSLHDAEVMAQSMIDGTERLPIAITDPALAVDDIDAALSQAGYGWIKYGLNRDGTEIVATPPVGRTLEECADAINESFRLGGEVLAETLTDGMTDREKVQALYDYIVGSVRYDFRYYSDRDNMPYESTVALGALRDGLAICGGYAQALETLLDMAGIENYTVSGVSHGEYHMWNYVVLDGQGYYCDPTADRGGMRNHFLLTKEELTGLGGYSWDSGTLERLAASGK